MTTYSYFETVMDYAKRSGRSRRQLAEDAGCTHPTIAEWLDTGAPNAFQRLEDLADSLGLDLVVVERVTPRGTLTKRNKPKKRV